MRPQLFGRILRALWTLMPHQGTYEPEDLWERRQSLLTNNREVRQLLLDISPLRVRWALGLSLTGEQDPEELWLAQRFIRASRANRASLTTENAWLSLEPLYKYLMERWREALDLANIPHSEEFHSRPHAQLESWMQARLTRQVEAIDRSGHSVEIPTMETVTLEFLFLSPRQLAA